MRKTKEQKAITLIALIITIVVLLILAAVAIASITNDGVLSYAENAATQYNQAVKNEQDTLQGYIDYLNKHNGGTGSGNGESSGDEGEGTGSGTIGTVTVGTIVTENSTINGEAYSSTNPIIPAGFKAINTETSKWDEGNLEDNVKNGLVISDEAGNEFVWIPVDDINEMAKVTSGVDANGRINYEGKLYDFFGATTEKSNYGQDTLNFREPANVISAMAPYEGDNTTNLSIWTENLYQESFNKMVESVAKYKGFYVGRYEMSLDASGKAQSKSGVTSSTSEDSATNKWWGLYEKALTYSTSGVVSEMIWGCQYDAMMRWMKGNDIDVEDYELGALRNTTRVTGSSDSNDILNNVYDLLGNSYEWTQEANDEFYRVCRGGFYDYYNAFPSFRRNGVQSDTNSDYGSRLTLYVEV